ncbi:hypothetical protein OAH26_00025 [bacterium]|nr:hypothetical protein [bacterium]
MLFFKFIPDPLGNIFAITCRQFNDPSASGLGSLCTDYKVFLFARMASRIDPQLLWCVGIGSDALLHGAADD